MRIIGLIAVALCIFSGCRNAAPTAPIPSVCNFDKSQYLGLWYEIARLPHSFERGMSDVTAEYRLRSDGKIEVINSGWRDGKKYEIRGFAEQIGDPSRGELQVTFFWPFASPYRIVAMAPDYSSAMVTSATRDYLWILARRPQLPAEVMDIYRTRALNWGFDVSRLEYPQISAAK